MPKFHRSRTIEEITIISAAIVVLFVFTPFAIFRFFNEQYLAASIEALGIVLLSGIGFYVWKTKEYKKPAMAASLIMVSALSICCYAIGASVLFWVYPIIITVFFLNPLKSAIAIASLTIFSLVPLMLAQKTNTETIIIITSLTVCQLCGYVLSNTIRNQYEQLEELINLDGLTGAYNRRAFDEKLQFLVNFSKRHPNRNQVIVMVTTKGI